MFWKKGGKDGLEVSMEETDRSSFRVTPLPDEPLILLIEGQPCRVYDISAGGASFQSPHRVVAGDVKDLRFKLPYPPLVVTGKIKIVAANRDMARGAFLELADETRDKIHLYVLETQKRRLKQKARPDRTESPD